MRCWLPRRRRRGVARPGHRGWSARAPSTRPPDARQPASDRRRRGAPVPNAHCNAGAAGWEANDGLARRNCGIDGWSIAPAGVRGIVNDAIAVYVSSPTCAVAFVARWCLAGDPPGFYDLRQQGPAAACAGAISQDALGAIVFRLLPRPWGPSRRDGSDGSQLTKPIPGSRPERRGLLKVPPFPTFAADAAKSIELGGPWPFAPWPTPTEVSEGGADPKSFSHCPSNY
jgi:hypothetical protein